MEKKNCLQCGKEFEFYDKRLKYCSRKCSFISRVGKSPTIKTIEKMRISALKPGKIAISIKNLPKNQKGKNHPLYKKPIGEKKSKELEKKVYSKRRNKTFEEIYGLDKSKKIREKMENSHKNKGNLKIGEWSKEHRGENNPNWQGGKSFEPYTKEFNEKFKELIRQRDGLVCLKCGMWQEDSLKLFKRRLHIHHIDYNKLLSIPQNCVSLCQRCNTEVNSNRSHWTKFFQSLLSERYEYKYSETGEIILNLNTNGC